MRLWESEKRQKMQRRIRKRYISALLAAIGIILSVVFRSDEVIIHIIDKLMDGNHKNTSINE